MYLIKKTIALPRKGIVTFFREELLGWLSIQKYQIISFRSAAICIWTSFAFSAATCA